MVSSSDGSGPARLLQQYQLKTDKIVRQGANNYQNCPDLTAALALADAVLQLSGIAQPVAE